MLGFLVILGLIFIVLGVWLTVVSVQFLRVGTKAFRRYLYVTDPDARVTRTGVRL